MLLYTLACSLFFTVTTTNGVKQVTSIQSECSSNIKDSCPEIKITDGMMYVKFSNGDRVVVPSYQCTVSITSK